MSSHQRVFYVAYAADGSVEGRGHYLTNHQGSIIGISDAAGHVNAYTYDAYGNLGEGQEAG